MARNVPDYVGWLRAMADNAERGVDLRNNSMTYAVQNAEQLDFAWFDKLPEVRDQFWKILKDGR
jgi:hypothetical protein